MSLGKVLQAQTDIAKKQYQALGNIYEIDETINKKPTLRLEGEESTEESVDLSDMPALKGDEVKKGKGLRILPPNKLLTRLPVLLAQIKAGNNSYKLKNEIRQILYLLYQHNKITKKVYKILMKSL